MTPVPWGGTGLALGYEDANDAGRLGNDPIHNVLLGRDPIAADGGVVGSNNAAASAA